MSAGLNLEVMKCFSVICNVVLCLCIVCLCVYLCFYSVWLHLLRNKLYIIYLHTVHSSGATVGQGSELYLLSFRCPTAFLAFSHSSLFSCILQPRLQGIQSATGENLTEAAQIADRWKGYCEDLYCDEEGKGIEQEYWEQEPPPLRSEVARAIRQTASRKATGPDKVPAELFKAGGETVLDRMHRICVAIWETGEWPGEWTFSTFVPLPKKGDLKQCANYRIIARFPCKQDHSLDHVL